MSLNSTFKFLNPLTLAVALAAPGRWMPRGTVRCVTSYRTVCHIPPLLHRSRSVQCSHALVRLPLGYPVVRFRSNCTAPYVTNHFSFYRSLAASSALTRWPICRLATRTSRCWRKRCLASCWRCRGRGCCHLRTARLWWTCARYNGQQRALLFRRPLFTQFVRDMLWLHNSARANAPPCTAAPRPQLLPAFARSMSACVRECFGRMSAMDPELRVRLAEWLAYHLSVYSFLW